MPIDRINPVNVNNTQNKKDPVKKGALAGAVVAETLYGASTLHSLHSYKKLAGESLFKTVGDAFDRTSKELNLTKKNKAAMLAIFALVGAVVVSGIGTIGAGIGAGIGKLVKNHNEKKEAEKQEIIEEVKTELDK